VVYEQVTMQRAREESPFVLGLLAIGSLRGVGGGAGPKETTGASQAISDSDAAGGRKHMQAGGLFPRHTAPRGLVARGRGTGAARGVEDAYMYPLHVSSACCLHVCTRRLHVSK
jgi:hypothetical protein